MMDLSPRGIREHLGPQPADLRPHLGLRPFRPRARRRRRLLLGADRPGRRAAPRLQLSGDGSGEPPRAASDLRPPPRPEAAAGHAGGCSTSCCRSSRSTLPGAGPLDPRPLFGPARAAGLARDRLRRRRASGRPGRGASRRRPDRRRALRQRRRPAAVARRASAACATSASSPTTPGCCSRPCRTPRRAAPSSCSPTPGRRPATTSAASSTGDAGRARAACCARAPSCGSRPTTPTTRAPDAARRALASPPSPGWPSAPDDWRSRPADWPPTRYEAKALAAGRRLRLRRPASAPPSTAAKAPVNDRCCSTLMTLRRAIRDYLRSVPWPGEHGLHKGGRQPTPLSAGQVRGWA